MTAAAPAAPKQWFKTGEGELVADAEADARNRIMPDRFWVPDKESRELVFLDDLCVNVTEHNFQTSANGWKNHLTCNKEVHEDGGACCASFGRGGRRMGFYTVADSSGYVNNKKERVGVGEMKFLAAPPGVAPKLLRLKQTHGGLALAKVRAHRDGKENVGDSFDFVNRCPADRAGALFDWLRFRGKPLKQWFDDAEKSPSGLAMLQRVFSVRLDDGGVPIREIVSFNYEELLRPLSPEDMAKHLKSVRPMADEKGRNGGSGSAPSEGSPF